MNSYMRKKRPMWVVICCTLLVVMLLSGCAGRKVDSVSQENLHTYMAVIPSLDAVFESHQIKMLSYYSDDHEVILEVRRIGDHTSSLSEKEIDGIKQAFYLAAGAEFPLNIKVYTIGEQPGMTGTIRAIDKDGRVLVVSTDKFIGTEKKMPDAAWYTMANDADVTYGGKPLQMKDLKIGSSVNVWAEGMMLTSYPGQTSGLRLEVTAWDEGTGDAKGVITGLEKSGEGVNEQRMIAVDGVKYRLSSFAQVWKNGLKMSANDLKVEDHVKIWFAGYEAGTEKIVTQVVIER